MARRSKNTLSVSKTTNMIAKFSPSTLTLAVMVAVFFLSAILLAAISSVFGWIPIIGGLITGIIFAGANLPILFLGVLTVFVAEYVTTKNTGKSLLALLLFFIFWMFPFGWAIPIILILVKISKQK